MADPFSDTTPANRFIIVRGTYDFLRVAVKSGTSYVPPDTDAFDRIDIVSIKDPDGVDKTSLWVTKALDPSNPSDVYDGSNSYYVGLRAKRSVTDGVSTDASAIVTSATAVFTSNDVGKTIVGTNIPAGTTIQTVSSTTQVTLTANATGSGTGITFTIGAENVGLFHNGSGRIAQKVLAPTNAEVTVGTNRTWSVTWKVKKSNIYTTLTETFNVAASVPLSTNAASATEVTRGITTALSPSEVDDLIAEATSHVNGVILAYGYNPDTFDVLPKLVREAIILYARALVFDMDASARRKFTMLQEGQTKVSFSGNSSKDADNLRERSEASLALWLKYNAKNRKPRMTVIRQSETDSPLEG